MPEGAHAAGWYPRASVEQPVGPTLRRASGRRLAVLADRRALVGAVATVASTAWTATDEPCRPGGRCGRQRRAAAGPPAAAGAAAAGDRRACTGEQRRSAVEDAARSRPDDLDAQLALVAVDLEFERREEAAAALERAAAIAPDDPRVAAARLTLGYDPGSPQTTIDAPRDAGGASIRTPPWRRFQLGVAQLWAGHADTAAEDARRPAHARGRGHLRDGRRRPPAPGHGAGLPAVLHRLRPGRRLASSSCRPSPRSAPRTSRRSSSSARRSPAPAAATTRPRRSRGPSPSTRRRWRRRSRAR